MSTSFGSNPMNHVPMNHANPDISFDEPEPRDIDGGSSPVIPVSDRARLSMGMDNTAVAVMENRGIDADHDEASTENQVQAVASGEALPDSSGDTDEAQSYDLGALESTGCPYLVAPCSMVDDVQYLGRIVMDSEELLSRFCSDLYSST